MGANVGLTRHSMSGETRRIPLAFTACTILFLVIPRGARTADEQVLSKERALEILSRQSEMFRGRPPYSMRFETTSELDDKEGVAPNSFRARWEGQINNDGERVEVLQTMWTQRVESAPMLPGTKQHFFRDSAGTRTHTSGLDEQGEVKPRRVAGPGETIISIDGTTSRDTRLHHDIRPDSVGWFADGVLIDSEHFSETLLRTPDLSAALEDRPGEGRLMRLEGTTQYGHLRIWLSDEDPPSFRSAEFKSSPDFYADDQHVKRQDFSVQVLESDVVDGIPVVTKAVRVNDYTRPEGEHFRTTHTVTRSEIRFHPDFEAIGAFQFQFPEGGMIFDLDLRGVRYRVVNGELTPIVDERAQAAIARLVEQSEPSSQVGAAAGEREPAILGQSQPDAAESPTETQGEEPPSVPSSDDQGGPGRGVALGAVVALLSLIGVAWIWRRGRIS